MSYDRDEWRRPWRADQTPDRSVAAATPANDAEHGAEDIRTEPIARYPQPPPEGWDERSAGPGSPAGSVRPPDTTGTVDAPARSSSRSGGGVLGAVTPLLGAVVGTATTIAVLAPEQEQASPITGSSDAPGDGEEGTNAPEIEVEGGVNSVVPAVAEAVTPSVVRVDVEGGAGQPGGDGGGGANPFGGPGGPGGRAPSLGSGVIYDSDGYIMTNAHVVEGAEEVSVQLSSGETLDAEVVGSDELNDLAILEVDRDGLPAINLRDDDDPPVVGEQVIAIGSPFGLDASVTTGVLSALNREITVDEQDGAALVIPSVLQTDAAINPGNSGGALVDSEGRLLGINTAILSRTGASQGIGFAVSAEQAVVSADQLIEQGFVRNPLLGLSGIDVTPEVAEELDLEATRGAVVDSVQDDTGADDAGVRAGDIVIGVDDEEISTMSELIAAVRARRPDDVIELTIVRDGEERTLEATLGERPR